MEGRVNLDIKGNQYNQLIKAIMDDKEMMEERLTRLTILKRLKDLEDLNKSLVDDKLFLEARIEKLEYVIGLAKPNKDSIVVSRANE